MEDIWVSRPPAVAIASPVSKTPIGLFLAQLTR